MFRFGLAAVLSGALAVSSVTATAARADNDAAIAAGILGALALFAITQNQRDHREPAVVGRSNRHHDAVPRSHRSRQSHKAHRARPRHARTLPGACSFDVESRHGVRRYVSGRCLSRHDYRGNLPDRCEHTVRTRYGPRPAYPMRCLDRYGYRLSGGGY